MSKIIEFLNKNNGVSILISSISALISAIAVSISLYYNSKTQKQFRDGQDPFLSFRVDKYNGLLYLMIENRGNSPALDVVVNIIKIENNGQGELLEEGLIKQKFDLYPLETVQGSIAINGESVQTGILYPCVFFQVSFTTVGKTKKVSYQRSVTFSKTYDQKVYADVDLDLRKIESSLGSTARAVVRTANYLDGHQISEFDEIHLISKSTLRNDISKVIKTGRKKSPISRSQSIKKRKIKK